MEKKEIIQKGFPITIVLPSGKSYEMRVSDRMLISELHKVISNQLNLPSVSIDLFDSKISSIPLTKGSINDHKISAGDKILVKIISQLSKLPPKEENKSQFYPDIECDDKKVYRIIIMPRAELDSHVKCWNTDRNNCVGFYAEMVNNAEEEGKISEFAKYSPSLIFFAKKDAHFTKVFNKDFPIKDIKFNEIIPEFDIARDTSIYEIKQKIAMNEEIDPYFIKIVYDGINLDETNAIAECGIEDGDWAFIVIFDYPQIIIQKTRFCLTLSWFRHY